MVHYLTPTTPCPMRGGKSLPLGFNEWPNYSEFLFSFLQYEKRFNDSSSLT